MWTGTLIAESLRVGSMLRGVAFTIVGLDRVAPANLSPEQRAGGIPERWTLLHFEVADEDAARLAGALAEVLDDFGWYADLRSGDETIVVFAGRVFRYTAGDAAARAEAQEHGRTLGVPEAQLDWP